MYTVVAGDADVADGGNATTNLAFTDPAGNTGAATTSVTLSGESIDANAPVISAVSIPDVAMNIGDTVTVTITVADDGGVTYTNLTGNVGGFSLGNIDATIVMERPKLLPFIPAMRERIAVILAVELDQVSIKATTSERMGFIGREEGAAVMATVLINKNS